MGAVIANATVDTGRYAFYVSDAGNPSTALGKCSVRLVSTGQTAYALPHIEILDVNVTPTPEPTATARSLVPAQVVFPAMTPVSTEAFHHADASNWWLDPAAVKIQDGMLQIDGSTWLHNALFQERLRKGSAIAVNFKYEAGSKFALYMDAGDFGNPTYKRFGLYMDNDNFWTSIFDRGNQIPSKELTGGLKAYPDTWLSLLLVIGEDGRFSLRLWNPMDPREMLQYDETFIAAWSGLDWAFNAGADEGRLFLDDFRAVNLRLP